MLSVDNLHFGYGDRQVLRGVALEVRPGELVGIVGPNGAGKTTLIRLISGALTPSRGRITVDGKELSRVPASHRGRLVSVVPQNPDLPLSFRVQELVLMGRNPHLGLLQWEGRRDLEVATEAMRSTDTLQLAGRTLESLSGGERQRAVVALALAQEAPVMLLDEPTSNLDLAHQTGIMDLVRDVQLDRGGAVVVAIHDLTLAAQYCHRLVMLAEGRGVVEGPPGAVLTRENIERVYGADVFVVPHPQGGTPVVLPASGRRRGR